MRASAPGRVVCSSEALLIAQRKVNVWKLFQYIWSWFSPTVQEGLGSSSKTEMIIIKWRWSDTVTYLADGRQLTSGESDRIRFTVRQTRNWSQWSCMRGVMAATSEHLIQDSWQPASPQWSFEFTVHFISRFTVMLCISVWILFLSWCCCHLLVALGTRGELHVL